MLVVLVNGLPGSGKTTLAKALADTLGLPLFSKDRVKETLADMLGVTPPISPATGTRPAPTGTRSITIPASMTTSGTTGHSRRNRSVSDPSIVWTPRVQWMLRPSPSALWRSEGEPQERIRLLKAAPSSRVSQSL
ncbi:AAA family ATPase [Nonomuraea sp. NPDC049480]|uniref:AAA family ATPase n=1 Tax=Nonomuraea sp. NPDC049480 TaxID=3364353 RepID=UPI003795FAF0